MLNSDYSKTKRLSLSEILSAIFLGVISNLLYNVLKEMYKRNRNTIRIYIYGVLNFVRTHARVLKRYLFITKSYPIWMTVNGDYGPYEWKHITRFLGLLKVKEETEGHHVIW